MTTNFAEFDARQIDRRVRLAMRILEFEQTRPPAIGTLAKRVGLSPFHLSRVFTAQVGESCAGYSRRIRLDNSNNQLIHDTVPLETVAATFGYRSQAAFTRAYTRQFGMPPRQYVAAVLGRTQADYAASHIDPIRGGAGVAPLLRRPVRLVERFARPALARRFYGHDLASHWRRFVADLPTVLSRDARFAGMGYDNASVTPASRWRYDCVAVIDGPDRFLGSTEQSSGLDLIELPGGTHAEADVDGGFADLLRTTIGLFTEWLPARREFEPEGDPIVHWLETSDAAPPLPSNATIRIRRRGTAPAYNLRPLTRAGRPAGHRTNPANTDPAET